MGSSNSFDIKNLLPFHKSGTGVPGGLAGEDAKIAELDPDLNAEEHMYVRHYLGYADILLKEPPAELVSVPAAGEELAENKAVNTDHEPVVHEEAKAEGDSEAA